MFVESESTTDIAHGILSMQRIEIEEVVDAICDNISQQRTDLRIYLPERKNVLFSLLQEHRCEIEHVAELLGQDQHMSRLWNHMWDQLVASASNIPLREDDEYCEGSREVAIDGPPADAMAAS